MAPALRVLKLSGDPVFTLDHVEPDLSVGKLKRQIVEAESSLHIDAVSLVHQARSLEAAELLQDLLPAEGCLELFLAVQVLPPFDPDQPTISQLPALNRLLSSKVPSEHVRACQTLRLLLGNDLDAHDLDEVIAAGMVPRLVELCGPWQGEGLLDRQHNAAWSLTNICAGNSEQTGEVVKHGGVEALVNHLLSDTMALQEQSVWGLGNIAGDCMQFRDRVVGMGIVTRLIELWDIHSANRLCRTNIMWLISNLLRGSPHPDMQQLAPTLPLLVRVVQQRSDGDEVLACALHCLRSFCTAGDDWARNAVLATGALAHIVTVVSKHQTRRGQVEALEALRSVAGLGDEFKEAVISSEALPAVQQMLGNERKAVRNSALGILSKLLEARTPQVQAILDAGILDPFAQCMVHDESPDPLVGILENLQRRGSLQHLELLIKLAARIFAELVGAGWEVSRLDQHLRALLEAGMRVEDERPQSQGFLKSVLEDMGLGAAFLALPGNVPELLDFMRGERPRKRARCEEGAARGEK